MKKNKKILITVFICLLVTISITVGIGCYNYYSYTAYKTDYLEDYFDINGEKNLSTSQKIENAVKWSNNQYIKHPGTVQFIDPGKVVIDTITNKVVHLNKNNISSEALSSEDSLHQNATFKDGVLHLPNFFDLEFYQTRFINSNDNFEKISYAMYISNIQQYAMIDTIQDLVRMKTEFSPVGEMQVPDTKLDDFFSNIYVSFVPGTSDESLQNLEKLCEAIEGGKETMEDFELGSIFATWSYSLSKKTVDENGENKAITLGEYAIYDNIPEDQADKYNRIRYNVLKKSSQLGGALEAVKAEECNGFSFVIYYYQTVLDKSTTDVTDDYYGDGVVLLQGTFTPELINNQIPNSNNFDLLTGVQTGHATNFYQPDYTSHVKSKLITSCVITFVIAGIVTGLLGFVWSLELEQPKNNKKRK